MDGQSNSEKMQTQTDTVKIHGIMQNMRQQYSMGIIVARAKKAMLISKNIIKGGVDKQY